MDGGEYRVTNMKLINITSPQNINTKSTVYIQNIDKDYSVNSNELIEYGMPIRYIRDTCGGSNQNTNAHWVEIKAFNTAGQNIALGKSAVCSVNISTNRPLSSVTNGNIEAADWVGTAVPANTTPATMTVDLGFIEDIEKIVVYHYYGDTRTYENTKTEVSSDGVNWYTIFDSSIEGTYQETSNGHIIYLNPQKCTINKNGKIYSNEIIEI